jgi:hypothetical protein
MKCAARLVLALAIVVLIVVLLARYVRARDRHVEGFEDISYYSPRCGPADEGRSHAACRSISSGLMPSIESTVGFGNGLCCGRLGVPPPTS